MTEDLKETDALLDQQLQQGRTSQHILMETHTYSWAIKSSTHSPVSVCTYTAYASTTVSGDLRGPPETGEGTPKALGPTSH